MSIVRDDNLKIKAPKSVDDRYLNILVPYTSISAANTAIKSIYRYPGLTVNINDTEYWYRNGLTDTDLILKIPDNVVQITGTTVNGIATYASQNLICSQPNLTFDGTTLSVTGYITGGNVTSGVNPGHTHTGTSISNISTTAITTGILPVSRGGTGLSTIPTNYLLTGNGSSALVPQSGLTYDGTILNISGNISASRFISTVTGSTSPFQVTSCTLVTNLNADYLDGQHGSYYNNTLNTLQTVTNNGATTTNAININVPIGTAPLITSSCTLVTNLNSTYLTGFPPHSGGTTTYGYVPIVDSCGGMMFGKYLDFHDVSGTADSAFNTRIISSNYDLWFAKSGISTNYLMYNSSNSNSTSVDWCAATFCSSEILTTGNRYLSTSLDGGATSASSLYPQGLLFWNRGASISTSVNNTYDLVLGGSSSGASDWRKVCFRTAQTDLSEKIILYNGSGDIWTLTYDSSNGLIFNNLSGTTVMQLTQGGVLNVAGAVNPNATITI